MVAEKKENEKDQNGAERKRSSMGDQGAKKILKVHSCKLKKALIKDRLCVSKVD